MAKDWTFKNNSKHAKKALMEAALFGLEKAANLVEGRSKAGTPVRYGELRDTQGHAVEVTRGNPEAIIGSPLNYSIYVEKGTGEFAANGMGRKGGWSYKNEAGEWVHTKGQKPQPFLEPAFKSSRKDIQRILAETYRDRFQNQEGG